MQDGDGQVKEPEVMDFRSEAYLNAWVNKMQGRKLTQNEADTIMDILSNAILIQVWKVCQIL